MRVFIFAVLFFPFAYGLSVDDFIPDFLEPNDRVESSVNPDVAFKLPPATQKRTASGANSRYCERAGNVFCSTHQDNAALALSGESQAIAGKGITNNDTAGANGSYFNRNSNNYDQNAVATFNMTNSNQAAMQVYSPKLNEDQLKNNVTVPLQADKNTNINIGQQQIEFNIKY